MADRLTVATINLGNYTHNLAVIREVVPDGIKMLVVVKANAYGHGIEKIAHAATAAGVSHLGVASLGELKRVRRAGIETPVLILNYLDPASIDEAVELGATITIMDDVALETLAQAAATQNKTVNIHLKVDTGMNRAGCDPSRLLELAQKAQAASHVTLEGIFSHFAESEALDSSFTHQQLNVFSKCIETLRAKGINPPLIHCANSAATLAFPEAHYTMVRPGLVTYGLNPFPSKHPRHSWVAEHFRPVLSLTTRVAFVRVVEPGATVGYNRRWRAERTSRLALLPVGYGDGYRRSPHTAGKVLVNGAFAPIVGSIAMDQTVVDVTGIEGVAVGDTVTLVGEQTGANITADDIASAYETINYEVVTCLSDRIVREYRD